MGIEELGITPGRLIVRKKTDDSGDYIHNTYDILATYPWGANGIVYEMDNPNDANLFASAPAIFKALYPFVKTHSHSDFIPKYNCDCMGCTGRRAIESACPGKSWEEIKAAYDE